LVVAYFAVPFDVLIASLFDIIRFVIWFHLVMPNYGWNFELLFIYGLIRGCLQRWWGCLCFIL